MTQQTLAGSAHQVDLNDPAVTGAIIAAANRVVSRKRPGPNNDGWKDLGYMRKVSNTTEALRDVLDNLHYEYDAGAMHALAQRAVSDGHMEPGRAVTGSALPGPVAEPEPAPAKPAVVIPFPSQVVSTSVPAAPGLGYRPGWTRCPWDLLAAREAQHADGYLAAQEEAGVKKPRIEAGHLVLLAIVTDKTPNGRNGGHAYISTTSLAAMLGRDPQRIRKAIAYGGALQPWATGRHRNITVTRVSGGFSKIPNWWVDDLLENPGAGIPAKDTTKRPILSGQALTDLALLVAVTLQRRGSRDATTATITNTSGETLAAMAGLSRRLWLYGLAEANRRVWVTSEGEGGWSAKAMHTVHFVPAEV